MPKIKHTLLSFVFALPGLLVFVLFLFAAQKLHQFGVFQTLPFPPVISAMMLFLIFLTLLSIINKGLPFLITRSSDFFLPLLPLFILPSCVGVLAHKQLLLDDGIKIILALVIGLVLTLFATPFIFRFAIKIFPEK